MPNHDIRIYGTNVPERESGTVTRQKNIWTSPEIQMMDFLGRWGRGREGRQEGQERKECG
jgi:hypothetical protein